MPSYKYIAQKYGQGASNATLLTFTANAEDILRWGGVPAKNERFHGGFQRALSERFKKIIKYFEQGQISPGAIVVAFRPNAVQISDLGYPSSWPEQNGLTTSPKFAQIDIFAEDFDALDLGTLISRVRQLLEARPGFETTASSGDTTDEGSSDQSEDGSSNYVEDSQENSSDEDEGDDLDVGQSKLRAFYDFIGNQDAVSAWLSAQTDRYNATKLKRSLTKAERVFLQDSPEEKLRATLVSLLRPAMIVDGQHRVNGAAESELDNIEFAVCAIKDADWVEQVFQFVVLNKMAKPISKDFLTELLNTSLTNQEVDDIDRRLETIGIKNADRRIHKYINHDNRSPFAGLIAEAGEVAGADTTGKLSQQGMLLLAKRWRAIASVGKTNELNCFLKYAGASGLGETRQKWNRDYDVWMSLFFAFWTEVKAIYEPQQVWVKAEKYHLLYIVTLQALQDMFIESKAGALVKFTSIDDFRQQVREFFENVPGSFFRGWEETGLQSGKGWEHIKKAVAMFQSGKRLEKVTEESELFKKSK